ncbi:leucine-rich repeat domain-containing protein [Desulfitobacterium sp. AusDCA]|uniref:leucine-rich repeat domain-containing protein n=1 Tax=Desulfitobacterium sp. AusDCA TaxID=3240383 RepID=UPI003DA76C4C
MRILKNFKISVFLVGIMMILALLCFSRPVQATQQQDESNYIYIIENGKAEILWYRGNGGDVTIPSTLGGAPVIRIGNSAFNVWNKLSITSIDIPQGVTSIGDQAFGGCYRLTSITIPQGVTSIGDGAFNGCSRLTNINIPQGVISIGKYTFRDCSSLTSITIPQGVLSIGERAFYDCQSLINIIIPKSVTSIGNSAFNGCSSLFSVIFNSPTTIITGEAFPMRTTIIGYNISTAKDYAAKYINVFEPIVSQ